MIEKIVDALFRGLAWRDSHPAEWAGILRERARGARRREERRKRRGWGRLARAAGRNAKRLENEAEHWDSVAKAKKPC